MIGSVSVTDRGAAGAEAPAAVARPAGGAATRRTVGALLALAGLAWLGFAGYAKRTVDRVESLAVLPGGDPRPAPMPGDDAPFAPFSFGTVASLRGDTARAAGAVEALAAAGASFVVLHGEIGGDPRALAAAVRDRGVDVLHVPGAEDLAAGLGPGLQERVSAPRWWFRTRGLVFAGAGGAGPSDAAWLRSSVPGGRADVLVTGGAAPPVPCGTHIGPGDGSATATLHRVRPGREIVREDVPLAAPTLRDRVREAAVGPLRGAVATPAAFRLSLAAGAAALWLGVFLLIQRRTSTGTSGSASRNRFP